jgi:hypothetical protein
MFSIGVNWVVGEFVSTHDESMIHFRLKSINRPLCLYV